MQFHVRTLADYLAITAYLITAFALIGSPIKFAMRCANVTVGRAVPAPVLGLAITVLATWYWATPHGGVKPVARLLVAVAAGALLLITVLARRLSPLRSTAGDSEVRRLLVIGVICFVGIFGVAIVTDTQLFTREHLSVLSLGNNDAASYALQAQHLLDDGPARAGNIAGYDAGIRSLGFSGGAYAVLAAAASLTGLDVWRVMTPMMLVTLILGAYSVALLLRRILGTDSLAVAFASLAGFFGFYAAYLVAQWFFAQLVGIAIVAAIVGLWHTTVRSAARRDFGCGVLLAGIVVAAGLSIYPHMTLAGSIVLAPIAAMSPSLRHTLRQGIRTSTVVVTTTVLAIALAPGLAKDALDITKELEGVEAGWPLPSIYPSEMLGFQTSSTASQSWLTVAVSALILVALVIAARISWSKGRGEAAVALLTGIAVVLATYALVYNREGGPSYRQWKWATFFIPLFVSFASYATLAITFASGAGFPLRSPTYLSVSLDQINLRYDDRLRALPSVHLNTEPYWETMWLAYFLRDTPVTLGPPTYYPVSAPQGPWYLERNDMPLQPGSTVTPLNATYRLVRRLS
jgi:hypothetical protein